MTNLEIAIAYIKRGWSIIPIQKGTKIPAVKSWTEFQKRLPTEQEWIMWSQLYPDCNIAIICGEVSGLFVVDVDVKSGGKETAKTLDLPITLVANTPSGGNHYFYKWRKGLVGNAVGIRQGIDIRTDNGYVVAVGSSLPNGDYEWATDEDTPIADAPSWLEDTPQKQSRSLSKQIGVSSGSRNDSIASFIGKLLLSSKESVWETEVYPAVQIANKTYTPPLDEKELRTTFESIMKKESKNRTAENEEEQMIVQSFIKNKTKGTYDLAVYIVSKYNIITVGEKENEMFVYKDGMYLRAENEVIFPEIQRILTHNVTKSAKLETMHKIADDTRYPRTIFQDTPERYIPLQNGVYDMDSKVLLSHSPEYRFTYKFPITFVEQAECPRSLDALKSILNPDQLTLVQEWIGYYFYRKYIFKKALIIVGPRDSGKTTILEMITYLIGRENISNVTLQKMTSDKFSAAHLYEKHANLVDELSEKDITDTGNFKIATGGGSITGEYKFGNQFSFHNFSKLTFACNKIPSVQNFEDDDAYFGRWVVIRLENTLEKIIPNFIQTIQTEEERSGLFNWAMEGLERLLKNQKLSYSLRPDEVKNEMLRSGSSIATFVATSIIMEQGAEISKEDMYEIYAEYCRVHKISTQTIVMFGSKFLGFVKYASEGLITSPTGKRVKGWRNVALKKTDEQINADLEFQNL